MRLIKKGNEEIGVRLQKLREEKHMSQADFVRKMQLKGLDFSTSTYNRYEHGDTPIPLHYAKEFCDYFDVTMDYLINGTEISPDKHITKASKILTPTAKKAIVSFLTSIINCLKEI